MGATAMDLPQLDTWHYTTPALTVIGSRLANAIKHYYGQSTYYRGPSIDSASFTGGNRNRVTRDPQSPRRHRHNAGNGNHRL